VRMGFSADGWRLDLSSLRRIDLPPRRREWSQTPGSARFATIGCHAVDSTTLVDRRAGR
jgi:hypothetical protein